MKNRIDIPLILLALAAFMAPLVGGQVSVDAVALPPDGNMWLSAFTGAAETPALSHGILAVLCASALVAMLLRRKILQVPNSIFGASLMLLLALILMSVGYSSFRGASIPAAIEWLTYGIALYAATAVSGRRQGPAVILYALFGGCVLLALIGIRQYGDMKAIDPTWRVFAQWVNPNAMAAMLLVGLLTGFGLAINANRSAALGVGLGCVAIGFALFLTQSKGAILTLALTTLLFLALLAFWIPWRDALRAAARVLATLAAVFVLVFAVSAQARTSAVPSVQAPSGAAAASPGARIVNVGATAEQSVGFRILLWKTALELMAKNPAGTGINTFQYTSGEPGLITQTHLAHESYLQLGAEASVLAPMLLVAALILWVRLLFRGATKLPADQNVLRAGILAAVTAIAGHSLVDSDFSYYGVGLVVFVLLGVGLMLSGDAVAPEFLPPTLRRAAALGVAVPAAFLLFLGVTEAMGAEARGLATSHLTNDASNVLDSLRSMAPWDAEAWYESAAVAQDPAQQLSFAKQAAALGPTDRHLRLLAHVQINAGMLADAVESLRRALVLDPHNLPSLTLLADTQERMGEIREEVQTLRDIVAVEKTSYFRIRSIPELVVTDTFVARIKLARMTDSSREKAEWLQPAVDGFKQYLRVTVPSVIMFAQVQNAPHTYDDLDTAKAKLALATEAAKALGRAYRDLGDTAKAVAADADAADFAKPLVLPSAK